MLAYMIVHVMTKVLCALFTYIVTCEECGCSTKETTENLNLHLVANVSKGKASCTKFTHNNINQATQSLHLKDLIASFSEEERVTVFCERFVDMYL